MRDPWWFSTRQITAADIMHHHCRAEVWRALRMGDHISLGAPARRVALNRSTISIITKEMLQVDHDDR